MSTKKKLIENFSEQINDFIIFSRTELLFEEIGELYIIFQKIKNNNKSNLKQNRKRNKFFFK